MIIPSQNLVTHVTMLYNLPFVNGNHVFFLKDIIPMEMFNVVKYICPVSRQYALHNDIRFRS